MNEHVELILEILNYRGAITDLEKDILDTANKLFNQPFSRENFQNKVADNYKKHLDILIPTGVILGGYFRPFQQLTDEEVYNNLACQLTVLCHKQIKEAN